MIAKACDWKQWHYGTIEIEVDKEMLDKIIECLEESIDNAVYKKQYEDARDMIRNRTTLIRKVDECNEADCEAEADSNAM